MKIEIITTGDEVVQGVIVDTNSAWIAQRCSNLGHEVIRHTSVGDYIDEIGDVLKSASERSDVVIVSGGLGPTADDLTIDAMSKKFGVKLIRDELVFQEMKSFLERIGRVMSPSNEKQSLIPEGGRVLKNKIGTAPGIQIKLGSAEFFFLPGVPKELYQMFDDFIIPFLKINSKGSVHERILRCFGIPEAAIDEKLKGVDLGGARLSFRVKFPEILLKVISRADAPPEAVRIVDDAARAIHDRLGDVVYGEGEVSLSQVVGSMLRDRGMTISVAESCTGGLIANMITDVPGSSEYFERGVVTYSNRSKQEVLGVTEETLRAHGAVSRETAMSMSEGIKRISNATIGIGVTGIAGPGGGTPEKPVGTVHIALSTPKETKEYEFHFNRDRIWFKQIVAATTLDLVRKSLL